MKSLPTGPYLIRALYEWCVDSGHTPYLTVRVDDQTRVPRAFVQDGQIVLNAGPAAIRDLHMDNDWISFSARFGGVAHEILVPMANVLAIYARETGEGMAFNQTESAKADDQEETPKLTPVQGGGTPGSDEPSGPEPSGRSKGRPNLRVVK